MCSIYGYISRRNIDRTIFERCLRHRGPDGTGAYEDADLSLGHGRLSIIDLSAMADQPMIDQSGNFVIVFNGEIYNYQELREELSKQGTKFRTHSDTEVLLEAYKQYGRDCLPMLRGMFAFAIYDKARRSLVLARDRFGIKPLFFVHKDGQFGFASEVRPLVDSGLASRKISARALDDYFTYGSVQQPRTIYEDIIALMPASYIELDVDTLKHTSGKYYDYLAEVSQKELASLPYEDAVRLVREKLEEATRYHLVADVEVGAFLSGGIDSSAVVALMARYASKPIKTYSVGFPRPMEVEDESSIAARTAQVLNCDHTSVIVEGKEIPSFHEKFIRALDQPSADGFNTFLVSDAAGKHVKVVLSGLGGDEIFAGYGHFDLIKHSSEKKAGIVDKLLQTVHRLRPNRFTSGVAYVGMHACDATRVLRAGQGYHIRKGLLRRPGNPERIRLPKGLTALQTISACEIEGYLLSTLLRDSDVMSMAHSLECRPVLLDHVLVETALALPDDFKIRDGVRKSVFIDAVKDLIPRHVYERKKTGFEMPLESWMNDHLRDSALRALTSQGARILFSSAFLKDQTERARKGTLKRDFWSVLALLAWIEESKSEL